MKKCQLTRCMEDAKYSGDYVVDREYDKKGKPVSFEIKPVSVSSSMHDIIYSNSDHVIFMSATILDKKQFCFAHGLPINDTVYIDIESPFDPEAFGIVYCPIASMKQSEIDNSIPKIINKIKNILEKHPNEKGLIHAANYKVTRAISEQINDDRLLVQLDSNSRNEIITKHTESDEPTVLVSPSMMEGLDLRNDLGRFQIICKVPFPYLGDSVVKKIMEKNKKWYSWRTALVMIQSVGRCVRNEEDWAKTYILDECFGNFFVKWVKFFPSSFGSMKVEKDYGT
jgi:ATP-dependent DNA helicase DinG